MFDRLSQGFSNVFRKLSGKGTITEGNVRVAVADVRTALLEADVALDVVNAFTENVLADAVGQQVTNTMQMKGQKPMTFKPTILKTDPAKELRWLGRLLFKGIFDGEHYFLFEASGNGTRFVQGEKFSGLLVGLLNMDDAKTSFEELNAALKKRVEG